MVHRRCPKCTLIPPCAHYETPEKIVQDASRTINTEAFKDALSPSKRNTLLKMVKSQNMSQMHSNTMLNQQDNTYYIDTLQGMHGMDEEGQTISINRVQNASPVKPTVSLPHGFGDKSMSLQPEQDLMYDTQTNAFGKRRRTTGPHQKLEPLPAKKGGFLRKGEGNGGSPTNFVMRH